MSSTSERPYRAQRLLDLAVLVVLAIPAAIVGALCALAVRLSSRGPILFRQSRVGWKGQDFDMLKFRSMIDHPDGNPIIPDADRITRVGAVLRRTSLDELPQLLNVAKGEMSIVGPRPTLRYQVERYTPEQRRRLEVRPGLTGLAQISGRNAIGWRERIEYDLEYVRDQSLRMDLSILVRSLPVLVSGEGVEGHPTDDEIAAP
jgi:lipopolysaccharide/colanic/teichoic acid biosynthesis glycosyltransferase